MVHKSTFRNFKQQIVKKTALVICFLFLFSFVKAQDDFYIQNQNVSPTTITAGLTVSASCSQYYTGSSGNDFTCYLGYYLSTDATYDASDILLGDDNSSIGAGDEYDDESATLTIPSSTVPGTYYILFFADHDQAVTETDETNNVAYIEITVTEPEPDDFTISGETVNPLIIDVGLGITASCMQAYTGSSATTLEPYVGFYLSSDNTYDASDVFLAEESSTLSVSDLDDDESAYVTIPTGTTPGTYYILFYADYNNTYTEGDETNNVASVQITVTDPGPDDFTITSPTVNPASVYPGGLTEISCTQHYEGGNTSTMEPFVGYYLSTDISYDASDIYLAEDMSSLQSQNKSESENETVTIPATTAPGTYYILFYADYKDEYAEGDELNNVAYAELIVETPPADDFTIANESIPSPSVYKGGTIDVSCEQHYDGGSITTLTPKVGFYLSADNMYDASDILLGSSTSNLDVTTTLEMENKTLTIPAETTSGTYYIIFVADYDNAYTEGNETNNETFVEISVLDPVDDFYILNQTSELGYPTVNPGGTFGVSCDQYYAGPATSDFTCYLGYYLSTDNTYDASDLLLAEDNSSIGSDVYDGESADITIPAETSPGTYYILFYTDHVNSFIETDETNNVEYIEITVVETGSDDFFIQNPALTISSLYAGETTEASCLQAYNGGSTESLSVNMAYYFSQDNVYDTSDILLAYDASTICVTDIDDPEDETLTIPTGTTPGTYYILFFADYDKGYTETNETNNIEYAEINVLAHTYTITTSVNPAETGTVSGDGPQTEAETCELMATPATGYEFVNWTEDGTEVSTDAAFSFIVTGDRTLVANFELQSLVVTSSATPSEGGTLAGDGTYIYGSSVTLTATVNTGYNFINWTEDGTEVSTDATYSFTITSDRTLVANFEIQSFTVNASTDEGGTVSGDGNYNYGSTATLTATANTGYDFINWTEDGTEVSTNAAYSFTVTANRTLVANFTLQSYTINASANPSEGGTVNGDGTYDYGSTATLTATANAEYNFVNWTEDGTEVSTNETYSFTVTSDRTLVANFELPTYIITANTNPEEGGTVSGDGTYEYGTTATLFATENTGYNFINWTEDGSEVSTSSTYSFTVTSDRILVANFEIQSFTINASSNPAEGGTIEGSGNYNYGSTATLIAAAYTDYDFVNWTENGTEVSTDSTYSFTVTENRTIVANFTESISTNDLSKLSGISIYPNPATNQLNIDLNNENLNSDKIEVALYDIIGKICTEKQYAGNSQTLQLDISALNNGIYHLQIIVDHKLIKTEKIIIK